MKIILVAFMVSFLVLTVASAAVATMLSLPDSTVTAEYQLYTWLGYPLDEWWGELVSGVSSMSPDTIDIQNLGPGQYVELSGIITGMSNPENCRIEIALMDYSTFLYWHTVPATDYPGAMGNGIYALYDSDAGTSLSLDENNAGGGPYTGTLGGVPWEFTVTMYPTLPSGGDAYFSVVGADMYGTQPFTYTGDYSNAVLVAQIYSTTEGAWFSFENVHATVVPEPTTMLMLGCIGAGLAGARRLGRKK